MTTEGKADACPWRGLPKDAVQIQINSELLQEISNASEEGSRVAFRLEAAGGVLSVGNHHHRMVADGEPQDGHIQLPQSNPDRLHADVAIIRQKLSLQVQQASDIDNRPEQMDGRCQVTLRQISHLQKPPSSKPSSGNVAAKESMDSKSRSSAGTHASGAQRTRSGSPPPWADKVGNNAVFRPALGLSAETSPAASVPSLKPAASPPSIATAAAQNAARQRSQPSAGKGPTVRSSTPGAQQPPSKAPGASEGRQRAPESRSEPKQAPTDTPGSSRAAKPVRRDATEQVREHSRSATVAPPFHKANIGRNIQLAPPEQVRKRSQSESPETSARAPKLSKPAQPFAAEYGRERSQSRTREPSSQAPKQDAGLPRQPESKMQQASTEMSRKRSQSGTPEPSSHRKTAGQPGQPGKPPLRPGYTPSRDATPDTINASSSTRLSTPASSRDTTPEARGRTQWTMQPEKLRLKRSSDSEDVTTDTVNASPSMKLSMPGSSRDKTPEPDMARKHRAKPSPLGRPSSAVNASADPKLSKPGSSRDNSPQPSSGNKPLAQPSPLGRPNAAIDPPGATEQAAKAKAIKKPRRLLGKAGVARRKSNAGAGNAKEMDIPEAALVGARKGLVYCLVGLISHKRYSSKAALVGARKGFVYCLMGLISHNRHSKGLAKALEEVARRVKDMRNPSPEFLREQALKIAEYKSPGMWVLMDRYQRFADELKAEATLASKPAGGDADTSAGAGANPEPEIAAEKPKQQITLAPGRAPALPLQMARSGSAQAAAVPQKAEKKRAAPVLQQDVEISGTESEGPRPSKRPSQRVRFVFKLKAEQAGATPSPSPMPLQQSKPAQGSHGEEKTPSKCMQEAMSPALLRPQTPPELRASQEADNIRWAKHAQRQPIRHAQVESAQHYQGCVAEYEAKHEDYMQIHQAISRTERYMKAIEDGYMAATTEQEEAWYDQQAERLNKRVRHLMKAWRKAYKVLHEELQDIKSVLEEYNQRSDLEVKASEGS